MALNWLEIDLILDELNLEGSLIQGVRQSSFKHLFLDIYTRDGEKFELLFAFNEDALRFHKAYYNEKTMPKAPRFCEYLRANLMGARIIKAEQIEQERIVQFTLNYQNETRFLFLRLWTGQANLIYTHSDGRILDLLFRRPQKNENPEEYFILGKVEKPSAGRQKLLDNMQVSFPIEDEGVNAAAADYYFHLEDNKEMQHYRRSLLKDIERRIMRQEDRIEQLRLNQKRSENESLKQDNELDYGYQANLISEIVHENDGYETGRSSIDVKDKNNDKTIKIALNPHLSLYQNIDELFRKNKRRRRAVTFDDKELISRQENLNMLEAKARRIEQTDDKEYLAYLMEKQQANQTEVVRPGLTFDSNNFVVFVGRNAKESDELFRHHVKGNDLWLHVRNNRGGFIFIRTKRDKTIPLPVLLDACELALHFSSLRGESKASIAYTAVKNVRRVKNGKPGEVTFSFDKNLDLTHDRTRLSSLLDQLKRD